MPVPRGHSPQMVGSQSKLATSLFLTSDLLPSSSGEVCLVWSLITWATLRSSAWRQQRFLSVFRNNKHGHVRDGDGTYSGLGLAWILLPSFSLVLAVKHADFFCHCYRCQTQIQASLLLQCLTPSDYSCSIGSDNIQRCSCQLDSFETRNSIYRVELPLDR